MAYRRLKRTRRTRKSTKRTPRTRRPRRSYVKKRPSGMMSKRRILNIASTKKRDNMALYDPDNTGNNFFAINRGTASFLWCPTYRVKEDDTHTENDRNASTVYMKGLSENLQLGPSTGNSWKWRRIVFETKGSRPSTSDVTAFTSAGYKRLWRGQTSGSRDTLASILFEGNAGDDWSTYFTAKVDRNRVKVHFDRTRILRNGNDVAFEKNYRDYYSFNSNLTYDDDENGSGVDSTSGWAANGRKGMGDIFIWDIFTDVGAPEGAFIGVRSHSTLYWHEK